MTQDIYGLLKHYRDELSWHDNERNKTYIVLSTRDVQDMLERYWREQIANEIEYYRNNRCRCEQTLGKDCDALITVGDIVRGQK
jgi:hypothetical protein